MVDPVPALPDAPHATVELDNAEHLAFWVDRVGLSREALARIVDITGPRSADVLDYLRREGLPGDTAS